MRKDQFRNISLKTPITVAFSLEEWVMELAAELIPSVVSVEEEDV